MLTRQLLVMGLIAAATPAHAAEAPAPLLESSTTITAFALAPDGNGLAFATDNGIQVWQIEPRKLLVSCTGHTDDVLALAFTPDGKHLLSGGADRSLRWWNPATGKQAGKLELGAGVTALACAKEGTLAVGDSAGHIHIVDHQKHTTKYKLSKHSRSITSVAFSPDGKQLASGSSDRTAILWDLDTRKVGQVLRKHRGWVTGVAFADANTLATVGRDQHLVLWDVKAAAPFLIFEEWGGGIQALASAGPVVADAGLGKVVHLRHEQLGKEIACLEGQNEPIQFLAFADASKRLIAVGKRGIRVWDVSAHLREGPVRPEHFSAKVIDELWNDLGSSDEEEAYRTVRRLARLPELAVPMCDRRLETVSPALIQRIDKLVKELDSAEFGKRERASRELARLGYLAESAMKAKLKDKPSLEAKRRIDRILSEMPSSEQIHLREERALDVLERIDAAPAQRVLTRLAGGARNADLTRKARAAIERLKEKEE